MNGWIFIEIIIAGFFLWTVIDPMYVLMVNHLEDKGYEEEGRYVLQLGSYGQSHGKRDTTITKEQRKEAFLRIAQLVKEQPEVDLPEEGEEEVTLIPSPIFSPNEDGINDLWEIDGIEKFPDAKVEIYDRFGKLLSSYEGYENDKGWDGTYNGEKLPSTDYWYVITVHAISKVYYGHFTLVRR
jgi:gliding motility-associated-like protein